MKNKIANLIVIGGPVAVGKSTLVASLGFPFVEELMDNNIVQDEILRGTYSGDRVSPEVVQLFFAKRREQIWKKSAFAKELHVLDRSILETEIFARANFTKERYIPFAEYVDDSIKFILKEYGYPKKYIILTCSWDEFEKRIFKRNRKVEIESFEENREFWKEHIENYEPTMKKIFDKYNINHLFINTNGLSIEDVKEKAELALKMDKII